MPGFDGDGTFLALPLERRPRSWRRAPGGVWEHGFGLAADPRGAVGTDASLHGSA